ncbi:MAG: putative quinol monooxygenase [Pseudonocardiaceae bacterium]
MTITVRAEVRVLPDKCEEFVDLAMAASDEVGTLRYDWYSSEDPTVFVVIEEYANPDAAIAHNEHCEELRAALLRLPS